jgi:flavin-dependent dehydrogenase
MTDLVIVGGGPAGLTTALALDAARPGRASEIVVLERARYPREKPCAGALGRRGDDLLATIGVRVDVPGVPINGMALGAAGSERTARTGNIGRVVRRIEFDAALAAEVRRRGIRVVEGAKVESLVRRGYGASARVDVVTDGAVFTAPFVVGADGVGSVARRALGLPAATMLAQVLEVDTPAVAADRPRDLLYFDLHDRELAGYFWDFPTLVDGEALVCRGVYQLRSGTSAAEGPAGPDLTSRLGARLAAQGLSIESCKRKRYSERGYVSRERVGDDRCLLVGEAAGIDPTTGEGIAQAIEYGVLAGHFLARVLRGRAEARSWGRELARSRLGLDLRVRSRLARAFYGDARPELEAMLVSGDSAVRAGSRHFGGKRHDLPTLSQVGWNIGRAWLEHQLHAGMRARVGR